MCVCLLSQECIDYASKEVEKLEGRATEFSQKNEVFINSQRSLFWVGKGFSRTARPAGFSDIEESSKKLYQAQSFFLNPIVGQYKTPGKSTKDSEEEQKTVKSNKMPS